MAFDQSQKPTGQDVFSMPTAAAPPPDYARYPMSPPAVQTGPAPTEKPSLGSQAWNFLGKAFGANDAAVQGSQDMGQVTPPEGNDSVKKVTDLYNVVDAGKAIAKEGPAPAQDLGKMANGLAGMANTALGYFNPQLAELTGVAMDQAKNAANIHYGHKGGADGLVGAPIAAARDAMMSNEEKMALAGQKVDGERSAGAAQMDQAMASAAQVDAAKQAGAIADQKKAAAAPPPVPGATEQQAALAALAAKQGPA